MDKMKGSFSFFGGSDKALTNDKTASSMSKMGKKKAQVRGYNSKSSPIYKTQSDISLVNGLKNLSLQEKTIASSRPPPPRRGFCTGSGKASIRNLTDVADLIKEQQVKNIVVVAGAGISTPSGIPDFRTPGTGLYDNLQQYNIPYPEAIFDIDYFHHYPRPFFTLAKELYPSGKYRPNYTHYFARMLHDKGMLLRMYTQNIDGLERLAGLPPNKLVEAHGTFATATCTICSQKYSGEDIKEKIFDDKLPRCKRSGCPGIVKPDIVFFGEELPKRFYYYLKDMLQTDLVLIMGTSLEVMPFAGIIDNVRWNIPRVLFNMTAVGPFRGNKRSKDIVAEGDLLETVQKFVGMVNWKMEMSDLITKCEGEFKIFESFKRTTSLSNGLTSVVECWAQTPTPNPAKRPLNQATNTNVSYASLWRQNARLDLLHSNFNSSSSDTLSSESETESSDDDDDRSKKKPGNKGQTTSTRLKNIQTDPPSRKLSTTSSQRETKVSDTTVKKAFGKSITNGVSTRFLPRSRASPVPVRRVTTDNQIEPILRPQSDSKHVLFRRNSWRRDTPTPLSNGNTKIDRKSNQNDADRKASSNSVGYTSKRPPLQPSSRPHAAVQQKYVDKQKVLFRAGSAEMSRLTYRHRLSRQVHDARIMFYGTQSSSESSDETSDDDDNSR